MLSDDQISIRKENVKKVVVTFLKGNYTISEVAKITGLTSSTVQRYLHDVTYIQGCFGANASEIIAEINDRLDSNKKEGLSRGGTNYSKNNECTKDELGHFTGSKRK